MNFLPHENAVQLIGILNEGLARRGFHFLSGDELRQLWEQGACLREKRQQLHALAKACDAKVQADARFSTARFVLKKKSRSKAPLFSEMPARPACADETTSLAA